jgi:hypothetical protein
MEIAKAALMRGGVTPTGDEITVVMLTRVELIERVAAAEARVAALESQAQDAFHLHFSTEMERDTYKARVAALEAAARRATLAVIRSPRQNGGKGECAGCWSSWGKDSTETQAWHYADCPMAALAALLAGDA